MNILQQKHIFFNRAQSLVPKQVQRLFSFGTRTLSAQPVVSVRGNARLRETNYHTAKTKAYRLTDNNRWPVVFPQLLASFKLVTDLSIVALDFSTFRDFQILTFAIQTGMGRAMPVYFEIIQYPIKKGSQNLFIREAIERFVRYVGCRPKLVMDRGFAAPHLLQHLAQANHLFIVRIKSIKTLTDQEKVLLFKAKEAPAQDLSVRVYNSDLRFVVSDDPENGNEPWYLITNDTISVRNGIVNDYYHRFEIEEFFKDVKWLQGLETIQVRTIKSMSAVLWFVILGWWFMAALSIKTPLLQGRHLHDKLSFPRLVAEALARAEQALIEQWLSDRGCLCAQPG